MEQKKFTIRVPATTANLGPGFDSMGMALQIYNEIEIEQISNGIEIHGFNGLPLSENLVYTAMEKVLTRYKRKAESIRIVGKQFDIPMSRGLGSSAASIVAGILIANHCMDRILSVEEIINLGTEMEGHPDNIVPAVLGGLTISIMDGENVVYSNVSIPRKLQFAVMVPEFKLSTHEARSALPSVYEKKDCIFNISRAALLVAAMQREELEKLRAATGDKVHQPYRAPLIQNIYEIFQQANDFGSKAEVISGSGSTLLAMVERENKDFKEKMENYLNTLPGGWKIHMLEADEKGAVVY
ncbi:homoserine kinase [Geosporobacter ferrireducens]|uniref:Homoserine kinase n=1 Tax=Geosporobacter ferrireducens TaxID=1424294 RepID=A0A1D8GJN0_9FIRM|nr:homoserine kinase [Geosporobacter ferrireducens]AOT71121.1 homoserine kinase [Geosporobacter ferrireducens]